jgi:hypothetical protein
VENLRCFADFNTSMQFLDDDRVIISARQAEHLGERLQEGMAITVFDEELEADGVLVRNASLNRWEVRIDKSSYRDL